MSKKDYIKLAEAIRKEVYPDNRAVVHFIKTTLCDFLQENNSRFNKETFLKACVIDY